MLMHRHPAYLYLNMQEARDNFAQVIRILETHPVYKGAVVTRHGRPVAVINAMNARPKETDGVNRIPLDAKYARKKEEIAKCATNSRQQFTPDFSQTPTLPEIRARIIGQIKHGPATHPESAP